MSKSNYVYISLHGRHFSPERAEQETSLKLSEKREPEDIARYGTRRGKPRQLGSARLAPPEDVEFHEQLEWVLDALSPHIDRLYEIGMEDAEVWIVHYFHGGQANMYNTPSELQKLARLGLPLCVSCYQ